MTGPTKALRGGAQTARVNADVNKMENNKKDKSVPPPAKPLSREDLTLKVKEFPINYGASIVGITTLVTLAGGPPSTDLTYVLEEARSAVTFAVPLDALCQDARLFKQDRS